VAIGPKDRQMEVIAEQRLFALFQDGEKASVRLCVGRPVTRSNGSWICPVDAEGLRLWEGPTEFLGAGSWHALMLGLRFLREILSAEIKQGAVFHFEGGKKHVSVEELFVLHEIT